MSNKDETYKDERTPHQRAYDDATAVVAGPYTLEDDAQRNLGRCYRELLDSIQRYRYCGRTAILDWEDLPQVRGVPNLADGTEDPADGYAAEFRDDIHEAADASEADHGE